MTFLVIIRVSLPLGWCHSGGHPLPSDATAREVLRLSQLHNGKTINSIDTRDYVNNITSYTDVSKD